MNFIKGNSLLLIAFIGMVGALVIALRNPENGKDYIALTGTAVGALAGYMMNNNREGE